MRIVVVTTSYPRDDDDIAGAFVRSGVEHLRDAGHHVDVVSPATVRHFGLAYGDGMVNNLRRRPWRILALPLFLGSMARAARRAAHSADVVHAHWLPMLLPALATRRPVVLQFWGSDLALASRCRALVRPFVRRASSVVVASEELAAGARRVGAEVIHVIPNGVEIPEVVVDPAEPPHALYIGRLSEEKGVRDLADAAAGLPLVVVGDGPLRSLFPEAAGFVSPRKVGNWLDRAAVVVAPSRREGYGVAVREAMAHGRPVVASAVGGLLDAIDDGVNGVLVPPQDPAALRGELERLLADPAERQRLGVAARAKAEAEWGWDSWVKRVERVLGTAR